MVGLSNPIRPLVASLVLLLRDMKRGTTTFERPKPEAQGPEGTTRAVLAERENHRAEKLGQARSQPIRRKQQWLMGQDLPVENALGRSWEPEATTRTRPDEAEVRVCLPGVTAGEVDVSLRRRTVLTVSGISAGRVFYREVPLPSGVDEHGATARLEDGMLRVHVPGGADLGDQPSRLPVESG
ncbi:Hsp20/alpha crystallin family protein [Actinopolyspora mortivallis]|uniref:Hsp20/alpha crystallin family protein n=1 Tax=Actinopolyspora mortivallis TaxID=33906 RepID=UPI002158BC9C|nr:Hsp20/alpha crystallin family protein [Actinopolyspora mortivallis]